MTSRFKASARRLLVLCCGLLPSVSPAQSLRGEQASAAPAALHPAPRETLTVPRGTHIPLVLANGVNTRTAKPGDAVYFETAYPIAVNNRMAIPPGSFLRGRIVASRRPGRLKGRGEFRIAIEALTFSNGYTVDLLARPDSVDRDGREGVDSGSTVKGPSAAGQDAAAVLSSALGGAFIGTLAGAAAEGAPGHGALLGGGIGGSAALAVVLATRGPEAELPRGTTMDIVLDRPLLLDGGSVPASGAFNGLPVLEPPRERAEPHRPRLRPQLWPWPR